MKKILALLPLFIIPLAGMNVSQQVVSQQSEPFLNALPPELRCLVILEAIKGANCDQVIKNCSVFKTTCKQWGEYFLQSQSYILRSLYDRFPQDKIKLACLVPHKPQLLTLLKNDRMEKEKVGDLLCHLINSPQSLSASDEKLYQILLELPSDYTPSKIPQKCGPDCGLVNLAKWGNIKRAELLIQKKPKAPYDFGQAFLQALRYKHTAMAHFLLKTDFEKSLAYSDKALVIAATKNLETFVAIILKDERFKPKDPKTYHTALHVAAVHGNDAMLEHILHSNKQLRKSLYQQAPCSSYAHPLMVAAAQGHLSTVRLLVNKYHADPQQKDLSGNTASDLAKGQEIKDFLESRGSKNQRFKRFINKPRKTKKKPQ